LLALAIAGAFQEEFSLMDYRQQFFEESLRYAGALEGRSVLVVGCGTGLDCKPFTQVNADVTGLDICDDIGREFTQCRYHRGSIEDSGLPSDAFDLVFCIAFMEHVHGLERAFSEMVRIVRRNGLVYSVAAPLWNSRRGHHFDCLNPFPWIHLRMDRNQIVEFADRKRLSHNGLPLASCMAFLFDSPYFNRLPAREYVKACGSLQVSDLLRNDFWMDGEEDLLPEVAQELRGYTREELLSAAHTLVARK
jgi:SAM-dependent methyltransferase